ncbi:PREDICTED: protein IQ-DOMAIN 31-like isoform X2 [Camelina sativa]|uniref:Protein IQ-DOMAIN 31-like isoform X2 n=1 Tax=Camelina sativa TaxID=90675 RepID=A0ABM0Y5W5_CAMSA|nr:PREDICTED: protein IQ-DOMAIN 31-like isoform X2 [Camelina sativa]
MGKTPGKWIKTLLLGKKSPKSSLENRSQKLGSAKKEELVVSVTEDLSNLTVDPPVVSSQPVPASSAQNVANNGDESKDNLESGNDLGEIELERAAIKVQATFRAHQARRAFRTLKGIIRLQAFIRGHLVRRQAIATYSCIFGIVKFQALVRGQKARSSDNGIVFQKTHMVAGDSEALQSNTYSWMDNPTKFVFVNQLLASSATALPLKIQYGPEEPNSAKVWLVRWTQLQVWSSGSRVARVEIPKSQSKKRNYEAVVEADKARPKRGIKKPSGPNSGTGAIRSSAESDKPKRNVRKASTLSKDAVRTESNKAKPHSRKSRGVSKKEVSPLEIKDEKPSPSLKRSSLSNGSKKATFRSAEKKKKDTADSVQIEHEEKVSEKVLEGGDNIELAETEKSTLDSVQIEPEGKVLEGGDNIELAETEKSTLDSVQIEPEGKVLEGGDNIELAETEKSTLDSVQIEPEGKVLEGGDNIELAETEKSTLDSVQIEPEGKVLEGGDNIELAETEKSTLDSVQIEPEGKVLEGGDNIELAETEKSTLDSVQIEPEGKVLVGGDNIVLTEKEKDNTDAVPVELDVVQDENSPVLDKLEEDEPKTAETNDKGDDLKCSEVEISSENSNVCSDNTKPTERRALLPAKIDNQDHGLTHSGRKIPSYMAPTASAKARVKGESSPRFSLEKTEINGSVRRHSLSSPANGQLSTTTMSPRAHKLLLASAKGSMNGDKSLTSSKDITHKSTRSDWKR